MRTVRECVCVLALNFMDTGTWTLRCYRCNKTFEVELKPTQRVIQYAQQTPCPHCNMKPAEAKAARLLWKIEKAYSLGIPKKNLAHGESQTEEEYAYGEKYTMFQPNGRSFWT